MGRGSLSLFWLSVRVSTFSGSRFITLLLDVGGGLLSLIVTFPRELFIVFFHQNPTKVVMLCENNCNI